MKIDEIHPSWPNDPPKVVDNLPPAKPKRKACIRTVCKHYYKKCFERIEDKK